MNQAEPLSIVEEMVHAGVNLVVIGGHAVNFHGYPRATQDVDIIVRRTPDSDTALHRVLTAHDAFWISDEIDPTTGIEKTVRVTEQYVKTTRLMMVVSDVGYLDVFDFVPGLPGQDIHPIFETSQRRGIIPFVSLGWLRKMKAASGRPLDLIDLEKLPQSG